MLVILAANFVLLIAITIPRFVSKTGPKTRGIPWPDFLGLWILSLVTVMWLPAALQNYRQNHSLAQAAHLWGVLSLYTAVFYAGLGWLLARLIDLLTGGPWRRSRKYKLFEERPAKLGVRAAGDDNTEVVD
jgi:hypothetical protein